MDFLYDLQLLRENCGSVLPMILSVISEMIIYLGPLACIILYLCIDKRLGAKILFVFCGSNFVCETTKLTACVKRPWLQDSRLYPADAIKNGATGYSFPSGHTSAATAAYGGVAQWLKKRIVTIICIFMIFVTGFSRMFLGAHTLADVSTAMIITLLVGFVGQFAFKYFDKHPDKDIWVLIIGLVICIAVGLYLGFKSYPLDIMEDGRFLYVKMQEDGFASVGMMSAWIICWFAERRFIKFDMEGSVKNRVVRGLIAVVIFLLFYLVITKQIFGNADRRVYYFFKRFLSVVMVLGVYPWSIKMYQKRSKK